MAHRGSITGVYQYIQPNGYTVEPDGTVALPPDDAVLAATTPLLAAGLENGVCVPIPPPTLLSGNATKAVPALVAQAVKFNFTTIILDVEPSPGVNGTLYCANVTAHLLADFLRTLVAGMHPLGRRVGICIEMGCLLGPEYWRLYAATGVDTMMSMGSTYYNTVPANEGWLQKEMAQFGGPSSPGLSQLAVGIGAVSKGSEATNPECFAPAVTAPWPTMYGWNQSSFESFMAFIERSGFVDVDLFRNDWMQMATDCVPDYYYDALQHFLLME